MTGLERCVYALIRADWPASEVYALLAGAPRDEVTFAIARFTWLVETERLMDEACNRVLRSLEACRGCR